MATSEKYFLKINPRNTVPGSNIRQVREAHVADLVQKMLANGVSTAMAVSVYEPFPDRAARDLPQDERDQLVFEIRDGAHRLAALRRLQDDPNYPEYGDDYRFEVQVVPSLSPVLERTIDAAGVNTGAHQVGAKRTFCDELWSMLRVRSDIVRRLVAYSSAFVRDPENELADAGPRARETIATTAPNPPETAIFKAYYEKLKKKLLDKEKNPRVFDPAMDGKWLKPRIIFLLLCDEKVTTDNSSHVFDILPAKSGLGASLLRVKWCVLEYCVPHGVLLAESEGDVLKSGGSGVVRKPGDDTRLWDYMCLVNNSLRAEKTDHLTYTRMYVPPLYRYLELHKLCALLSMTRLVATTNVVEKKKKRNKKNAGSSNAWSNSSPLSLIPAQVNAIYRQYNSSLRLVPELKGLEEGLSAFIAINRHTLLFEHIAEPGVWSAPDEREFLAEQRQTVTVHPELQLGWADMTSKHRAIDNECREVAKLFIEDINGVPYEDDAAFETRFGDPDTQRVSISVQPSDITSNVASRVSALRMLGFRELFENVRSSNAPLEDEDGSGDDGSGDDGGGEDDPAVRSAGQQLRETSVHSDASADGGSSDEVQPQPKRRAIERSVSTPPPTPLVEAQKAVLLHLKDVDKVYMQCAKFEDWGKSDECAGLEGKVALILTDPPYNCRRIGGAPNSDYDELSDSDMKAAAEIFCKLLRPGGQLYIFCGHDQFPTWREVLNKCGGGQKVVACNTHESIMLHPDAVKSRGRFSYHRQGASQDAVHAFKRITTGEGVNVQEEYARLVAFSDTSMKMLSGNDMPAFAGAMTNYRPPVGREVLKWPDGDGTEKSAVRQEQKGVNLLRDLIRIHAPRRTDIVVDLFAGTMSTVVAALMEGHPVYACEMEKACFELGAERVHALAYRRAAAGLVPGLSDAQVELLKKSVCPSKDAVDLLEDSDERELASVQVQAPVVATVREEEDEEDEITPRYI